MKRTTAHQSPTVVDLFAGCGGMSRGFQLAGFDVLVGCDHWQPAVDTYRTNSDHDALQIDLGDAAVTIETLAPYMGSDTGIVGGPPCQDFSSAGKRVEGDRADLTRSFATIVTHFLPPFFVMENVARAERSVAFSDAMATFADAGYHVERRVVDASLHHVPQRRKRLITVGTFDSSATAAVFAHLESLATDAAMTVRDHLGDRLDIDAYYRHPRSYARRGIFSVDEPSPTVRGMNRPVPPGYTAHPGDAASPRTTRPLTTGERAAIQTFPDDYVWVGARTNVERMIGNAVPVNLARDIAISLLASGAATGRTCACSTR